MLSPLSEADETIYFAIITMHDVPFYYFCTVLFDSDPIGTFLGREPLITHILLRV